MFKRHDPPGVKRPVSAYALAVETPANVRTLHVSGQVPVRLDGSIPADFDAQYELVWENIRHILASAGMELADLVKMTTYITSPAFIDPARNGRDRIFQGLRIASTLAVISALADPRFMVEIEVTAAKA
jgi:enamine deaminase RidA (YjgF/YER057c/UK114 family)